MLNIIFRSIRPLNGLSRKVAAKPTFGWYRTFPKRQVCGDREKSITCVHSKEGYSSTKRRALRSRRGRGNWCRRGTAGARSDQLRPATPAPPPCRPCGQVACVAPGFAHARGDADTPASCAQSPSTVTPASRPSFPRRSRDHGRSSREADQDQNRRGEAVRSRTRRRPQSLFSFASWRPERPGGAQARGGRETAGLFWGSTAGWDGLGWSGVRGCPSLWVRPSTPLAFCSKTHRWAAAAPAPLLSARGRGVEGRRSHPEGAAGFGRNSCAPAPRSPCTTCKGGGLAPYLPSGGRASQLRV